MGVVPNQNSLQILKKLVPLNLLQEEDLQQLIETAIFKKDKAGTYLFRQGDTDYHNVYLLSGQVALLDKMREMDRITAGSETTRFPLAHQIPRKNSARAIGRVEYVLIDNRKLSELLVRSSDDDYKVSDLNAGISDDWMAQLLQSNVFQQIPAANIQGVIMRMEEVEVKRGQNVIEQGGEGDYFYLIHQGRASVLRKEDGEKKPTELAKLGPGDSFGEEALLSNSPRNSSVKMQTKGILLRLAKEDFIEFVKRPLARGVGYDEAASLVEKNAVWLDVRPPEDYELGHLGNSVSLPLNTLRYQAPNLDTDQHYVLCCDDGQLSSTAAFLLTDRGYNVSVLEGGLRSAPSNILIRETDNESEASAKVISLHSGEELAEDARKDTSPKEVDELKAQLATANTRIKELGIRFQGFKDKQQKEEAQRNAELKAQKVILDKTRARLDELRGKNSSDKQIIERLEKDASGLTTSLNEALEELNQSNAKVSEFENKLQSEQKNNLAIQAERDEFEKQIGKVLQEQEQLSVSEKEQKELGKTLQAESEKRIAELEQVHKEKLQQLEQELSGSGEKLAAADSEKKSLQRTIVDLQAGQEGLDQQLAEARSAAEKQTELEKNIAQLEEAHAEKLQQLEQDLNASQEKLTDAAEEKKALEHSVAELQAGQALSATEQQKESENRIIKLEQEHKEKLHELEQELETSNFRLEQANKEKETLEKSVAELREEQAGDDQQEIEQLRNKLEETENKYKASVSDLEQAKSSLQDAENGLEKLQQEGQESDAGLQDLQQTHSQIESELAQANEAKKRAENELLIEKSSRQQAEAELQKNISRSELDSSDEAQVLRTELSSLTEALSEADFAYDEIREKVEILSEEKEKNIEKIQKLEGRESEAKAMIEELTDELEKLKSEQEQQASNTREPDDEADSLREELRLVQLHSNSEIKELQGELHKVREQLEEKVVSSGFEKAEGESIRQELEELRASSEKWEKRLSQADTKCISLEDAIEDRDGKIDKIRLELEEEKRRYAEIETAKQQNDERLKELQAQAIQDSAASEYVDSRLAAPDHTLHMDDVVSGQSSGKTMALWGLVGAVVCFAIIEGLMMFMGRGELITGLLQQDVMKPAQPQIVNRDGTQIKSAPGITQKDVAVSESTTSQDAEVVTDTEDATEELIPIWSVMTDINFGPSMVRLRGGSYTMGSNRNQVSGNEWPAHEVEIKSFAIGRFEVTFDEYDRFAQSTGRRLPEDEGWGRGQRPVVNVSWDDAVAYTDWLSERTGKKYRLPTEAEWEYAIRSGSDSTYWWGYQMEEGRANCFDCGSEWDRKSTAPVGSFPANNFGLHDLAGNVREWIQDCYHPNYDSAPQDGAAWMESACKGRVVRGGTYNKTSDSMRSTWRGHFKPDSRLSVTGFRVVREL